MVPETKLSIARQAGLLSVVISWYQDPGQPLCAHLARGYHTHPAEPGLFVEAQVRTGPPAAYLCNVAEVIPGSGGDKA